MLRIRKAVSAVINQWSGGWFAAKLGDLSLTGADMSLEYGEALNSA